MLRVIPPDDVIRLVLGKVVYGAVKAQYRPGAYDPETWSIYVYATIVLDDQTIELSVRDIGNTNYPSKEKALAAAEIEADKFNRHVCYLEE
jgi:hypothetical protein